VKDRLIRYKPGRDPEPEDRTDWDRLRRMTDEEVEAAALSDPDAQPMTEAQLAATVRPNDISRARKRTGLSQAAFAERFHLDLRSLQDWERGRRLPEAAVRAYLRVIERNPDAVAAALED
jgi:putative transcriptional regulator